MTIPPESPATGTDEDAPEAHRDGAGRTGVLAALPEEVAPLLERMSQRREVERAVEPAGLTLRVTRGRLAGHPLSVGVTGDGHRNARAGARAFLRSAPVDRLLVVGVGGALTPDLEPGSVLLARRVWRPGSPALSPATGAVERVGERAGMAAGTVVTVDRLLHSPGQKASVRDRIPDGARDEPAVADLESGHYVDAAREAGLSWLVLRCVSDDASERLPAYLEDCRDESGALRRVAVAGRAALQPTSIPRLFRLRRRVSLCGRHLAAGVERILTAEAS